MDHQPRSSTVQQALQYLDHHGTYRIRPLLRFQRFSPVFFVLLLPMAVLAPMLTLALIVFRSAAELPVTPLAPWLVINLLAIGFLLWGSHLMIRTLRSSRTLYLNWEGVWYSEGATALLSMIRWEEIKGFHVVVQTRGSGAGGAHLTPRHRPLHELHLRVGCPRTIRQISGDPLLAEQPQHHPTDDIRLFAAPLPRQVAEICEVLDRARLRYSAPGKSHGIPGSLADHS